MGKTFLHKGVILFSGGESNGFKKIGEFLAELRKEQGLTQEQLGEKIGVTNKTISRWETGVYLPPADILLQLSEIYSVSINEILSGKVLDAVKYKVAAEENLQMTIKASSFELKDKIVFYKRKWLQGHKALLIFLSIMVIGAYGVGLWLGETVAGILLRAFVPLLVIVLHGWRNNTMMAYVEHHVYDRSGR